MNKFLELQKQKMIAESKITVLKEQLPSSKFCLGKFKHSEEHFKLYTGFETYEILNTCYLFCRLEQVLLFIRVQ